MGELRNSYKILVRKFKWKGPVRRLNIEEGLQGMD
jgi:hypothetical protein